MTPNLKLQEAIEICNSIKDEFRTEKDLHTGKLMYSTPAVFSFEKDYGRAFNILISAAQSIIAEECPECAKLRGKIAVLMSERPDMVLENAKLRKKIDDLYQFGKKECKLPKPSGEVTKIVRTANNEIIAITYEGKQYYPKELHPAVSGEVFMDYDEVYNVLINKLSWKEYLSLASHKISDIAKSLTRCPKQMTVVDLEKIICRNYHDPDAVRRLATALFEAVYGGRKE